MTLAEVLAEGVSPTTGWSRHLTMEEQAELRALIALRGRVEALLKDVEAPHYPVGSPGPLYTMGVLADKKEISRRLREMLKGDP